MSRHHQTALAVALQRLVHCCLLTVAAAVVPLQAVVVADQVRRALLDLLVGRAAVVLACCSEVEVPVREIVTATLAHLAAVLAVLPLDTVLAGAVEAVVQRAEYQSTAATVAAPQ